MCLVSSVRQNVLTYAQVWMVCLVLQLDGLVDTLLRDLRVLRVQLDPDVATPHLLTNYTNRAGSEEWVEHYAGRYVIALALAARLELPCIDGSPREATIPLPVLTPVLLRLVPTLLPSSTPTSRAAVVFAVPPLHDTLPGSPTLFAAPVSARASRDAGDYKSFREDSEMGVLQPLRGDSPHISQITFPGVC